MCVHFQGLWAARPQGHPVSALGGVHFTPNACVQVLFALHCGCSSHAPARALQVLRVAGLGGGLGGAYSEIT